MSWEQLTTGVVLPFAEEIVPPPLHRVDLDIPAASPIKDIEDAARNATASAFEAAVAPNMSVAVGAGSRGISSRVELLRGAVQGLRELGAKPFLVPAMGSHGGATAHGQLEVLASLGITEASIGAEIRATMETVIVATTPAGVPVHIDANAAAAERILPVNRIKPHTCFRGPIESGCMKMAVVGFGKQAGASHVHSCGPVEMRERLLSACEALRQSGRLLGGLASIESIYGEVAHVEALDAAGVGGEREKQLTDLARTMVPALPFDQIDVLIIDRGGKDISGTMIDPNVTGRYWVPGHEGTERPAVSTIVLLDITEASAGNALGIGLADFIPASLASKLDLRKTYINCFTAGPAGLMRSRLPMVLPDEESCIKAALSMCGRGTNQPIRVVRIESTLHLTSCLVSEALLQPDVVK